MVGWLVYFHTLQQHQVDTEDVLFSHVYTRQHKKKLGYRSLQEYCSHKPLENKLRPKMCQQAQRKRGQHVKKRSKNRAIIHLRNKRQRREAVFLKPNNPLGQKLIHPEDNKPQTYNCWSAGPSTQAALLLRVCSFRSIALQVHSTYLL